MAPAEQTTCDVFAAGGEGREFSRRLQTQRWTNHKPEAILFVSPSAAQCKNPSPRNFFMQPAPSDEPKEHQPLRPSSIRFTADLCLRVTLCNF